MKTRIALVPILGLSMLLGVATPATAQSFSKGDETSTQDTRKTKKIKKAKIGEAAPDFMLMDAKGKEFKLSDYKGKIVVLQWINPGCPVCKRVTSNGTIGRMVKELGSIDKNVVHLAINSTHNQQPEASAAYLKKYELDAPGLVDKDGTVGRLYNAKTTPHMFVIDGKGILRYNGALDDDKSGKKGKDAMNYVVNAVRQIVAGETVAPDSMRSYGCSVKYARGGKSGKSGKPGKSGRGGGG